MDYKFKLPKTYKHKQQQNLQAIFTYLETSKPMFNIVYIKNTSNSSSSSNESEEEEEEEEEEEGNLFLMADKESST